MKKDKKLKIEKAISDNYRFTFTWKDHSKDPFKVDGSSVEFRDRKIFYGTNEINLRNVSSIQVLEEAKEIIIEIVPKIDNYILSTFIPSVIGLIIFVFVLIKPDYNFLDNDKRLVIKFAAVLWFFLAVISFILYLIHKSIILKRKKSELTQILERLDIKGDEESYYDQLLKLNIQHMNNYYTTVHKQNKKSFNLTLSISIIGFLILGYGIFKYNENDNFTSIVSILSGGVIEFISSIFFYLYNKSVNQLNLYHEKLINVQNAILALIITQKIDDNSTLKDETIKEIAKNLTSNINLKNRTNE